MVALIASPFAPISKSMSSHRAAQAVIYADQLKRSGQDVVVNMSADLYHDDFNRFDVLYAYHGNDWSGNVNLFGGLESFGNIDNFINFSRFKGKVYSLMIEFPDYMSDISYKMQLKTEKNEEDKINPLWHDVDWDNLVRMQNESTIVDPNNLMWYPNLSVGDSHAICMYRPGWMNLANPFKTLYGALKMHLNSFIYECNGINYKNIEFYFGNIDVRHHLLRQSNPEEATRDLVKEYFIQCEEIADKYNCDVTVYELLPIESERRQVPKTGWYKGTAFYGSQQERNEIRLIFKDECKRRVGKVKLFEWVNTLINDKGELDFQYMEKPRSVHLSREYYPHWQGKEWNNIIESNSLEQFMM